MNPGSAAAAAALLSARNLLSPQALLRHSLAPRSRPRSIIVSLVVDDDASRGLVAVRDNGVGMTPQVSDESEDGM